MVRPLAAHASRPGSARALWAFAAVFSTLMAAIVVKAWVCDDAYITIRTLDNYARGLGLVWNPGERVQVYTHPLWMLLLAAVHRVTGEFYYSTLGLGFAASTLAVLVLAHRVAASLRAACAGIGILLASRAFTDYATSGLENPLSHLLIVLFAGVYLRAAPAPRRAGVLGLLTGLLLLVRQDNVLLVLPAVALLLVPPGRARALGAFAAGVAPFAAWEVFALVYYGSLVPNTAFAKLNAGLPAAELAGSGLLYLRNSMVHDPVTLAATLAGIAVAFRSRDQRAAALGAGTVLYILYVVRVGGDFMSGRFLTAPLVLATAVLVHRDLTARVAWPAVAVAAALVVLPVTSPFVTREGRGIRAWDAAWIADERAVYARSTALLYRRGQPRWPHPRSAEDAPVMLNYWDRDPLLADLQRLGVVDSLWPPEDVVARAGRGYRRLVARGAVGFLGYYGGPGVHVLDYHALGDPLLSRLPAAIPDPVLGLLASGLQRPWRPGHFCRLIPDGYPATVATGENRLRDPDLARYYDRMALVVSGRLFDPARWRAIWGFHRGRFEPLLEAYLQRHPEAFGTRRTPASGQQRPLAPASAG